MEKARETAQSGSDQSQSPLPKASARSRVGFKAFFAALLCVGVAGTALLTAHVIPSFVRPDIEITLFVLTPFVGLAGFIVIALRSRAAASTPATSTSLHAGASVDRGRKIGRFELHTLVKISRFAQDADATGWRSNPGEIVLHSGRRGDPNTSIPIASGPVSDSAPLRTQIDRVLFERLDEFKSLRPREGCVLLVTESMSSATDALVGSDMLSAAEAALSLARMIAASRDIPTLFIDTGSPAWSRFRDARGGAVSADVLVFPRVPGVYEILADHVKVDDWIVLEDDLPSLTALAPGNIPPDWADRLASEGMKNFLAEARRLADVTVVFGPGCADFPGVVRSLAESATGVLLVSGTDLACREAEQNAVTLLNESGAVVFGRITLVERNTDFLDLEQSGVRESGRTLRAN